MSGNLVLLATASDQAEAEIWTAILKGEGIPCVLRNTFGESSIERSFSMYSGLRLYVSAGDYKTASRLLRVPEDGRGQASDSFSTSFWIVVLIILGAIIAGLLIWVERAT